MEILEINNGANLFRKKFESEGYLLIKKFYNYENEILPIQKDIYTLISLIINSYKLPIRQKSFSAMTFDSGLTELLKNFRNLAGVLYDATKKIPSYVRLANSEKNEAISKVLLNSKFIGFAHRSYGLRMDNPFDTLHATQWHQEYVSNLSSLNAAVLWSPLRDVTANVGPVRICPGSHKNGIYPIYKDAENSKGLKIKNLEKLLENYKVIAPEVMVGDLLIADFKVLHCSSPNISDNTRWSMLSRYFDFTEPVGIKNNWVGGLQEGNSFERLHPELSEIIM